MSRIKSTLNAARMLGVFGFILVVAVIIIGVSIYDIFLLDQGVVVVREHSERRFALENVEYYLLDEELAERVLILHQGDPAIVEQFNLDEAQLDTYLNEVRELDRRAVARDAAEMGITANLLGSGSAVELDLLEADRTNIEQQFRALAAAYAAGQDITPARLEQAFASEEAIDTQLVDLVFDAEILLDQDLLKLKDENRRAIMVGFGGLILFPLLVVWAFLVASQLTRPILRLSNAVVAIGGQHYREELLDEVIDQRSGLGGLARVVDHMADALQARESGLEAEMADLRTRLHDARRRKLVLTAAIRREQ